MPLLRICNEKCFPIKLSTPSLCMQIHRVPVYRNTPKPIILCQTPVHHSLKQ